MARNKKDAMNPMKIPADVSLDIVKIKIGTMRRTGSKVLIFLEQGAVRRRLLPTTMCRVVSLQVHVDGILVGSVVRLRHAVSGLFEFPRRGDVEDRVLL